MNNYKSRHIAKLKKKQQQEEEAAAAQREESKSEPPPAAPAREGTPLRPPEPAPREEEKEEGVEESKEEKEEGVEESKSVEPPEEDPDAELRQDPSLVATSNDAASPNQEGASASFVVAVINTKGGTAEDGSNVRTPSNNPGITQTAAPLFQSVMTCLKLRIKETCGSVPAVWCVTEVPWVPSKGNMSVLSQCAPDAARSGKGVEKNLEAAVIWGAKHADGAEALTLVLDKQDGAYHIDVQTGGESVLTVPVQDLNLNVDQYRDMLTHVAAARLYLPVAGGVKQRCLCLSYHSPDKIKTEEKCMFLRWLLLLARSLVSDFLGIPVVLGGDFNLDVSNLEVTMSLGDATEGATLVEYNVNQRRAHNVVDWLYLINPQDGPRLVCERCVAIDPAQPYRKGLAAEECFTLDPKWFDHDVLLAVLRFETT